MISEYALIPDIFDSACYSNPDICDICLQSLKEPLLHEALVRDLYNGQWSQYVSREMQRWHIRTKEIIKKLLTQNRLRCVQPALQSPPANYNEWCQESLASHKQEPLTGIITSNSSMDAFKGLSEVASIEKLSSSIWWQNRSPSVRLHREINEYLFRLKIVLSHANSIMFIDPHIDPTGQQYRSFIKLLQAAQRVTTCPVIEIHRVCYVGSGPNRQIKSDSQWEEIFKSTVTPSLFSQKISVEVFIWDNFHDRYLISDIIGIAVPNGFDVDNTQTTWTRLGRKDRDDIQREFDPASNRHKLRYRFKLI